MSKQDKGLIDQLSRSGQLEKHIPPPESRPQNPLVLIGVGILVIGAFFLVRRVFPTMHFVTFRLLLAIFFLVLILGTWAWFKITTRTR